MIDYYKCPKCTQSLDVIYDDAHHPSEDYMSLYCPKCKKYYKPCGNRESVLFYKQKLRKCCKLSGHKGPCVDENNIEIFVAKSLV